VDMEASLTPIHCSTACCCQVEDPLAGLPTPSEAYLWPREVVTVGLLHALTGVGNRALYRWLTRDYRALQPAGPRPTHAGRRRAARLVQRRRGSRVSAGACRRARREPWRPPTARASAGSLPTRAGAW